MKKIYQTPQIECSNLDIQEMILSGSSIPVVTDTPSDTGQPNLSNKDIWGNGLW